MEHSSQHWVPRCYLEAWVDPATPSGQAPYVWVISRDGRDIKRKAPKNILREADMYTVQGQDGTRDLGLEKRLASVEKEFASLRRDKLGRRSALDCGDKVFLAFFVAAMHGRTKGRREFLQRQWGGLLESMESFMRQWERASPERRRQLAALHAPMPGSCDRGRIEYEDVKEMAERPLQRGLALTICVAGKLLSNLDLAILCTQRQPGFITSDAPCSWVDPAAMRRPALYRAPVLMYPTIEITLPLSPSQLILLSRQGLRGYIDVPDRVVDNLNYRTRVTSYGCIISNTRVTRKCWFGETPPEC